MEIKKIDNNTMEVTKTNISKEIYSKEDLENIKAEAEAKILEIKQILEVLNSTANN